MRRFFLIAVLLVASTTIALGMAEIALRAIGRPHEIELGWGLSEEDLEFVRKTYRAQLAESHGKGHLRVLLLGDSQVTNTGTSPKVLPAAILEEELRKALSTCGHAPNDQDRDVTVFTLGQAGWGQDQELLALSAVIGTVRPHLVLHWFTPENDLWNNAFPTHYPRNGTPKPTFVLEHDNLRLTSRYEILPEWTRSRFLTAGKVATDKIETRLRRSVGAGTDFTSHFPLPYDPDDKWGRVHLPPAQTARTSGMDDRSGYLNQINPYFEGDQVDLEKSHFVIAMNPESPRIEYMVRLTAALIRETQATTRRSKSEYAAFYYSAEKTNQPMYPPDGTYHAKGYEFVVSNAEIPERLAHIFDGIRLYALPLADNDWRLPHNDPHLTTPVNRHVLAALSRQLVESGLACTLPSD
jgi:hypothetical protein